MKKKILRFYADKSFDVPKLIVRKPYYLVASQVEAAAVELYYDIQKGEEIKPINIPRRVYKIAETVLYKQFEEDHETLENAQDIIAKLKARAVRFMALSSLLGISVIILIVLRIKGL